MKVVQNYAIFWGGGGGLTKRSHWITGGRGGGQDGPKKDHIIFERSLIYIAQPQLNFNFHLNPAIYPASQEKSDKIEFKWITFLQTI